MAFIFLSFAHAGLHGVTKLQHAGEKRRSGESSSSSDLEPQPKKPLSFGIHAKRSEAGASGESAAKKPMLPKLKPGAMSMAFGAKKPAAPIKMSLGGQVGE